METPPPSRQLSKQKETEAVNFLGHNVGAPLPSQFVGSCAELQPARSSWWLNHPFEKYARQIGSFPQVGVKIKNLGSHHLEDYFGYRKHRHQPSPPGFGLWRLCEGLPRPGFWPQNHQSMQPTVSATTPGAPKGFGHGKFPHRWDWSSPIAWGCPVQFGPKSQAGNPHSSPIHPSKCSHICWVKLLHLSKLHLMLSTIPSAWHCGPQCCGIVDVTRNTVV